MGRGAGLAAALTAASLVFAAPVLAADYPTRRILAVVPFPAGSGTDPVARFVGDRISKALGQPVVVDNKPGANGAIAAAEVSRAAPDGYTILFGTNSTHATYPHLVEKMTYDPVRGFEPITRVTLNAQVLVVRPEIPAATVAELIAYARARPGLLNYGVGNTGGIVANQQFKAMTGIDATQVSYRGAAQAVTDLLGGRLHYMFTDPSLVQEHVAKATLRALAVTGRDRMSAFPDLPTLTEAGLPGYDVVSWIAVFAPAGTPGQVIDTLNGAIRAALRGPEADAFFRNLAMEPSTTSPAELGTFVASEIDRWGDLIKAAGIPKQ